MANTPNSEQKIEELEKKLESFDLAYAKQGEITTDLVMRVTVLERILIKRNLVQEEELVGELETIGKELAGLIKLTIENMQQEDQSKEDRST